jgi:hypothetical protein
MKRIALILLLCSALSAIAQVGSTRRGQPGQSDPMALSNGVNWVRLSEPEYPPLARQGRIQGTVRIAIRFLGCSLDAGSVRVISGHPMLSAVALRSVQQSRIECSGPPNSEAMLYYDFQLSSKCHDDKTTVRAIDTQVSVRACVANPPPLP